MPGIDDIDERPKVSISGVNLNVDIDAKDDTFESKKDDFDEALFVNHFNAEKFAEEDAVLADLSEAERKALEAFRQSPTTENFNSYKQIFEDTVNFSKETADKYDFYLPLLTAIKNGDFSFELKKRYILKAIDETWVGFIEEHLQALDAMVRVPSRFIEQQEEIMPIALSRNINNRSIQHLSQHTNLISKIEGDEVTPSKILNVFNEETLMTYENKFVNTLVNRLFSFVARRYDAASKSGKDEKITRLNMTGSFAYGKVNGKINFGVEVSEEPEESVNLNNYRFTSDVWHRVEKLFEIIKGYTGCDFIKAMGRAYIRPPVMRTNAILKNKNLRQCLELWEFIESYEDVGYNMLAQEDAETVDENYIKELYEACTLQYMIFRYNIKNDFIAENSLADTITEQPLKPKFVSEVAPIQTDEFNLFDTKYEKVVSEPERIEKKEFSKSEDDIILAIDIALEADRITEERRIAEAERKRKEAEEARRLAEEQARKEAEQEEMRRREEERLIAEAEEAKRREEEERIATAKRQLEEEQARIAAEKAQREAEEAAKIAEAERREREEQEKKEEHIREVEAEVRKNEWNVPKSNGKISRKKKKSIKRAAEIKSNGNKKALPKTFNYDEYMQIIYKEKIEETEKIVRNEVSERLANEEREAANTDKEENNI